jgi:hypothetical protein
MLDPTQKIKANISFLTCQNPDCEHEAEYDSLYIIQAINADAPITMYCGDCINSDSFRNKYLDMVTACEVCQEKESFTTAMNDDGEETQYCEDCCPDDAWPDDDMSEEEYDAVANA